MSLEDKKELERFKTLNVRDDVPKDLRVAIESFMQQAIIINEYELDEAREYAPATYLSETAAWNIWEQLINHTTIAKYPKSSFLAFSGSEASLISLTKKENSRAVSLCAHRLAASAPPPHTHLRPRAVHAVAVSAFEQTL